MNEFCWLSEQKMKRGNFFSIFFLANFLLRPPISPRLLIVDTNRRNEKQIPKSVSHFTWKREKIPRLRWRWGKNHLWNGNGIHGILGILLFKISLFVWCPQKRSLKAQFHKNTSKFSHDQHFFFLYRWCGFWWCRGCFWRPSWTFQRTRSTLKSTNRWDKAKSGIPWSAPSQLNKYNIFVCTSAKKREMLIQHIFPAKNVLQMKSPKILFSEFIASYNLTKKTSLF